MTYGQIGIENAIIPQAELDRLRAENASLRAQIAAIRRAVDSCRTDPPQETGE